MSGAVCALSTSFSDLNSQTSHLGAISVLNVQKWVTFFFLFFCPPQLGSETSDAGENVCMYIRELRETRESTCEGR